MRFIECHAGGVLPGSRRGARGKDVPPGRQVLAAGGERARPTGNMVM